MASTTVIVVMVTTLLGFVCSVVSFAFPGWIGQTDLFWIGLWNTCDWKLKDCQSIPDVMVTDKFEAVRAMETIGLICNIAAVACFFVWFTNLSNKMVKIAHCALSFAGGVTIIIGVLIFGIESDTLNSYFHVSFGLACVAAVSDFISGTINLMYKDNSITDVKPV